MWHIFGLHWLSAHSTHTMQLHQMPDMGGHFLKGHVCAYRLPTDICSSATLPDLFPSCPLT